MTRGSPTLFILGVSLVLAVLTLSGSYTTQPIGIVGLGGLQALAAQPSRGARCRRLCRDEISVCAACVQGDVSPGSSVDCCLVPSSPAGAFTDCLVRRGERRKACRTAMIRECKREGFEVCGGSPLPAAQARFRAQPLAQRAQFRAPLQTQVQQAELRAQRQARQQAAARQAQLQAQQQTAAMPAQLRAQVEGAQRFQQAQFQAQQQAAAQQARAQVRQQAAEAQARVIQQAAAQHARNQSQLQAAARQSQVRVQQQAAQAQFRAPAAQFRAPAAPLRGFGGFGSLALEGAVMGLPGNENLFNAETLFD